MNEPMPYRFGQDEPARFNNKKFDRANEKYKNSPASRHLLRENKRPQRPKNAVASKFGLIGAEIGYTYSRTYRDYLHTKKDYGNLRSWARNIHDRKIRISQTGLTITVTIMEKIHE